MSNEDLSQKEIHADALYKIFQEQPFTFMLVDELAEGAGIQERSYQMRQNYVGVAIKNLRERHLPKAGKYVFTIDGAGGYVYFPEEPKEKFFTPNKFRETFTADNHPYWADVERVIEFTRLVDIENKTTARPKVTSSVYDDFIFFASYMGKAIQKKDFADSIEIDKFSVDQRLKPLRALLRTVPNNKIELVSLMGHDAIRMELPQK
jgi:hypothetical protein